MSDKVTVGNVEIAAVIDLVPPPKGPDNYFQGVPAEAVTPYADAIPEIQDGQIQIYFGCFVLRSKGKTLLVDTGLGPGPHPDRGNVTGDLVNQVKKLGIGAEDINLVVHTHLHADHVGWNLNLSGAPPMPNFPKARYLVPRLDWEYFTRPDILPSALQVKNSVIPLQGFKLMDLVDEGHAITEEITTWNTPGHTPGSQTILINSQGQKAMIIGDVMHSSVQVQEPSWCSSFDIDRPLSQLSRAALLDRAEKEGYIVGAGHFHPSHHLGRVVRLDGRRYWQGI